MGPRHFSRGIISIDMPVCPEPNRFNGAAAFQPRNSLTGRDSTTGSFALQWGRGISAAEFVGRLRVSVMRAPASMGPRHFSRGITLAPNMSEGIVMLQWGRGISAAELASNRPVMDPSSGRFNGAAAFQPRNLVHLFPAPVILHASMGPRHFSRGIRVLPQALNLSTVASMGPRHFSRGICPFRA